MDMAAVFKLVQPWLSQVTRDVLRTAGVYLLSKGIIQNDAGVAAFMGACMTLAGIFWGWFTTKGYVQVGDLLKKLTAQHSHADAVKAAQVLPPASAVDTALKSATVKSVTNVLIVAFAVSLFLATVPAMAQTKRTGPSNPIQQFNDQIKQDFSKATGVKATGDVGYDLLAALDAKLLPDLQYAKLLADANGNSLTSGCWAAWITVIETNQKAVMASPSPTPSSTPSAAASSAPTPAVSPSPLPVPDPHILTDVERAIDLRNMLQPSSPFMVACSPVANLIKTDVVNFIGQVTAGGLSLTTLLSTGL